MVERPAGGVSGDPAFRLNVELTQQKNRSERRTTMKHLGFHLGPEGYRIFKMPMISEQALANFEHLPEDPYYKERWRQFSQYIFFYEHDRWAVRAVKHRPFIQAKAYNLRVGGVQRCFEPVSNVDPTPQLAAIAKQLQLDKNEVFQVNLHQWRTRVGGNYKGITIPEGPHRDGHHITGVIVWKRHNVSGGESTLYQLGKTEPFFERVLEAGECILLRDEDMIHGARDIKPASDAIGYRDIWVIAINPWADRRYGDTYETYYGAASA
jgi:hypothetical protein